MAEPKVKVNNLEIAILKKRTNFSAFLSSKKSYENVVIFSPNNPVTVRTGFGANQICQISQLTTCGRSKTKCQLFGNCYLQKTTDFSAV